MEVLNKYIVSTETSALLPAKSIDFQTIVLENNRKLYVRRTPFEIIKDSCLQNWSTYEGRKQATIHRTGFKEKVPIPINPLDAIIALPTHGLRHHNCSWIMLEHIFDYRPIDKNRVKIIFHNKQTIEIDLSYNALDNQYKRGMHVKQCFVVDYQLSVKVPPYHSPFMVSQPFPFYRPYKPNPSMGTNKKDRFS